MQPPRGGVARDALGGAVRVEGLGGVDADDADMGGHSRTTDGVAVHHITISEGHLVAGDRRLSPGVLPRSPENHSDEREEKHQKREGDVEHAPFVTTRSYLFVALIDLHRTLLQTP